MAFCVGSWYRAAAQLLVLRPAAAMSHQQVCASQKKDAREFAEKFLFRGNRLSPHECPKPAFWLPLEKRKRTVP